MPRPRYLPGDLLLFAGRDWDSRAIAAATCSIPQLLAGHWFSHIGIVGEHYGRPLVFESTTLCERPCAIRKARVSGPQAHTPELRVASYGGSVWRLRLASRLQIRGDEGDRLTEFLLSKIGESYDYSGAAICATRLLRLARWVRPSLDRLFCSHYAMAALKDVGRVDHDCAAASYSPARAARDLQYWGTYQPLGVRGSESVRLK